MKILYIDTTTSDLTVALVTEDAVIDVSEQNVGVRHSETLCGKVEQLLKTADLSFNDLDAYACAVGPGSFTGIRIGISTVKGYAAAVLKPFIAVNCLQAIACSHKCHGNGSAAIDAGNGYYFYSVSEGVCDSVVPYDDERAKCAPTAKTASDYFDGAVSLIRKKYAEGDFDESLTPLYIRRSQAEINLKKENKQNG